MPRVNTVQKVQKARSNLLSVVPEMRRIRNIYFVGIGGAGMSGIAEVLLNQGYKISGSDIALSKSITRMQKLGMNIYIGHKAKQIKESDVVVCSGKIKLISFKFVSSNDKITGVVGVSSLSIKFCTGEFMLLRAGSCFTCFLLSIN